MILWEDHCEDYNVHLLNLEGVFIFSTVETPKLSTAPDLMGINVKDILLPSDFMSLWHAAIGAYSNNTPQFAGYGLAKTSCYFLALIDKFTDDLVIVYEMLETNIKNRSFIKRILTEAARIIKPIKKVM